MRKRGKVIIPIVVVLLLAVVLSGCNRNAETANRPISELKEFWDLFVYPMAAIMWVIGKTIAFGNYPVTIILTTLVVRTIAWPIYAKSNDLQLKMNLAQEDIEKVQARYAGREDQESKQKMSMETMQIYKKYGIGLGGCLAPLIQMPIFIGFYRTIARIPASITANNWIGNVFNSTKIFGVDMILKQNEFFSDGIIEQHDKYPWNMQMWGVIILAVLVGVTQIISIILSNIRQKKAEEEKNANKPAYRRAEKNPQQVATAKMMKYMLYFMAIMMVVLVWTSAAGLGLYWLVGNLYSTFQMWLGQKTSAKRKEKLSKKIYGDKR